MKKLFLLALLIIILIASSIMLGKRKKMLHIPTVAPLVSFIPTTSPRHTPMPQDETDQLFMELKQQTPQVHWGEKYADSLKLLKTYNGYSVKGSYTIDKLGEEAILSSYLDKTGWKIGNGIVADGPTGHEWGYVRGDRQLITTYLNKELNKTICPCTWEITVFITKDK